MPYAKEASKLYFGIPSGSLNEQVLRLLEGSGLWSQLGPRAHLDLGEALRAVGGESGRAESPRGQDR